MKRARFAVGALVALAACDRSDTGIEAVLHVGALQYDELRLRVTAASGADGGAPETLVDPESKGRFVAPFRPGDQSVVVFLSDALGGTVVHCEGEARQGGAVVATGSADVTVQPHSVVRAEIVMAGGGDPPGGGGAPDAGSSTDAAGSTGGGSAPHANGEACSIGAECLSNHCSDGVCCEADCHEACQSCALPDTKGLCRPVPAGTPDPRGMCADKGAASCQTNGLCDVGGCAVYPAGTVCAPAGCAEMDKMMVPERTCDGAGKCQDEPKKMKCPEGSQCTGGACS